MADREDEGVRNRPVPLVGELVGDRRGAGEERRVPGVAGVPALAGVDGVDAGARDVAARPVDANASAPARRIASSFDGFAPAGT